MLTQVVHTFGVQILFPLVYAHSKNKTNLGLMAQDGHLNLARYMIRDLLAIRADRDRCSGLGFIFIWAANMSAEYRVSGERMDELILNCIETLKMRSK